jgi:hypothetical protein
MHSYTRQQTRGDWSDLQPSRITPLQKAPVFILQKAWGPQSRRERCGKEKISLPIENRTPIRQSTSPCSSHCIY